MFDLRGCRVLIFAAFVLAGCDGDSERINLRVGLFFTEDTQSLMMPFEPFHYPAMDPKDDVPAGKKIVSTLTRASRRIFVSVAVLDSHPTKEIFADMRLDLVFIAQVYPTGGSLIYIGDSPEASNSLAGKLTCYNTDMIELASFTAVGEGTASAKSILFDVKRKAYANSVESAIRNLGDNVELRLSSNPEIRKMAE